VIRCKLCGNEITKPRHAWKESIGWVSPAGAKAMTLAHPTGELAHQECISLAKVGVHVGQETFV